MCTANASRLCGAGLEEDDVPSLPCALQYKRLLVYLVASASLTALLLNAAHLYAVLRHSSSHKESKVLAMLLALCDIASTLAFAPVLLANLLTETQVLGRTACALQVLLLSFTYLARLCLLLLKSALTTLAVLRPWFFAHRVSNSAVASLSAALALLALSSSLPFALDVLMSTEAELPLGSQLLCASALLRPTMRESAARSGGATGALTACVCALSLLFGAPNLCLLARIGGARPRTAPEPLHVEAVDSAAAWAITRAQPRQQQQQRQPSLRGRKRWRAVVALVTHVAHVVLCVAPAAAVLILHYLAGGAKGQLGVALCLFGLGYPACVTPLVHGLAFRRALRGVVARRVLMRRLGAVVPEERALVRPA